MAKSRLALGVIIGSTREGRFGTTVAKWFMNQVEQREDVTPDLIDLADFEFPINRPRAVTPQVEAYAAKIKAADAFVIITPEYNHGYPAPLKVAIDAIYEEWCAKPVGFVAYGGVSGGLRSVEQLRQVFAELHATTIRDTVSFHNAHNQFDEGGQLKAPDAANAAAKVLVDKLGWWGRALREARQKEPYTI